MYQEVLLSRIHSLCSFCSEGFFFFLFFSVHEFSKAFWLLRSLLFIVLTACLILRSPKEEEEEERGHGGSKQPQGRPFVMENWSKKAEKERSCYWGYCHNWPEYLYSLFLCGIFVFSCQRYNTVRTVLKGYTFHSTYFRDRPKLFLKACVMAYYPTNIPQLSTWL